MRLIDAVGLTALIPYEELNAKMVIANAPTVDAVEVVRCKDCKFYTEEERWCRRLGLCGAFDPNDYCSHGEKREDD